MLYISVSRLGFLRCTSQDLYPKIRSEKSVLFSGKMKENANIDSVVLLMGCYSALVVVTTPVAVSSDQLPCVVSAPVVTALQESASTVGVQVTFPNSVSSCRFASIFV